MRISRAVAVGLVLAILSALALTGWRIEASRAAWTPLLFPISFQSARKTTWKFHVDRTAPHLIALDLRCGTSAEEETLLDPARSKLPFSWWARSGEQVLAQGQLGSTRRPGWDASLDRESGQVVGKFAASKGQEYEIDSTVMGFIIARLFLLVGLGLAVFSVGCIGFAIVRGHSKRRPSVGGT